MKAEGNGRLYLADAGKNEKNAQKHATDGGRHADDEAAHAERPLIRSLRENQPRPLLAG